MGRRIDDESIAKSIEAEVKDAVGRLSAPPTIVSLELLSTPDISAIEAACSRVEIKLNRVKVSSKNISDLMGEANGDSATTGILVNGFMAAADPGHLRDLIATGKDLSGAGPMNAGRAMTGKAKLMPVEAAWPVVAVEQSGVNLWGKRATVLGRGDFLSRTLAMILIDRRATTTYLDLNRGTAFDLAEADVVFSAANRPRIVAADRLKSGCTVIEISAGDLDEGAYEVASLFLPAYGSAIAVALLLRNCLAERQPR